MGKRGNSIYSPDCNIVGGGGLISEISIFTSHFNLLYPLPQPGDFSNYFDFKTPEAYYYITYLDIEIEILEHGHLYRSP